MLFTNFLTPGLIRELGNPLDDWLDWLNTTNHRAGYLIRNPEVKILMIKGLNVVFKLVRRNNHRTFYQNPKI